MGAMTAHCFQPLRSRGKFGQALRQFGSWVGQETPNPDVRKFLGPARTMTLSDSDRGRLLTIEGVRDIFVSEGSWVAVTRSRGVTWEALSPRVEEVLGALSPSEVSQADLRIEPKWSRIEEEILVVLRDKVRPAVQDDGGDVELVSFNSQNGEVLLRLKGACRGCPQSAVTLQENIARTLKFYFPEVKTVVGEPEELDPLNMDPNADMDWSHDGTAEPAAIAELAATGTPFFSTFAGTKMEGPKLRRVRFLSRLQLHGRTPEHVHVTCASCRAKRSIEDPQDMLREDKGNVSQKAAIVICPTCAVLISP